MMMAGYIWGDDGNSPLGSHRDITVWSDIHIQVTWWLQEKKLKGQKLTSMCSHWINNIFPFLHGNPGLQVQVTPWTNSNYKAELKCLSSCRPPDHSSFTWYKNGQKTGTETPSFSAYFDPSDSVNCALKGHEDFPSPPVCEFTSVFHWHITTWWHIEPTAHDCMYL